MYKSIAKFRTYGARAIGLTFLCIRTITTCSYINLVREQLCALLVDKILINKKQKNNKKKTN